MRKLALVVAVGALLAASTAAVADATAPQIGTFSFEETFTVQPGDIASCTFPVTIHLQGSGTFQVSVDAEGEPTRVMIHETWIGTDSANGFVLPEHGATTEIIDFATGSDTAVGGITVRLARGVIHDAGRVRFDAEGNIVFEAGSHPGLDGDTAAYCAALTP
jgi:hypothetical protein